MILTQELQEHSSRAFTQSPRIRGISEIFMQGPQEDNHFAF